MDWHILGKYKPLTLLLSKTSKSNASLLSSGLENLNVKSFQSKLIACVVINLVKGSLLDLPCLLPNGSIVNKSKTFIVFSCLKLLTNSFAMWSIQVALSLQLSSTRPDRACPSSADVTTNIRGIILSLCLYHQHSHVVTKSICGSRVRTTYIGGLFVNESCSDPSMIFILRHAALVSMNRVCDIFF